MSPESLPCVCRCRIFFTATLASSDRPVLPMPACFCQLEIRFYSFETLPRNSLRAFWDIDLPRSLRILIVTGSSPYTYVVNRLMNTFNHCTGAKGTAPVYSSLRLLGLAIFWFSSLNTDSYICCLQYETERPGTCIGNNMIWN